MARTGTYTWLLILLTLLLTVAPDHAWAGELGKNAAAMSFGTMTPGDDDAIDDSVLVYGMDGHFAVRENVMVDMYMGITEIDGTAGFATIDSSISTLTIGATRIFFGSEGDLKPYATLEMGIASVSTTTKSYITNNTDTYDEDNFIQRLTLGLEYSFGQYAAVTPYASYRIIDQDSHTVAGAKLFFGLTDNFYFRFTYELQTDEQDTTFLTSLGYSM